MRLRKSDPTGSYWYDTDGVSAASPVLTDAYTTFTPGLSETNGLGTRFYLPDAQGHSRGLLDGGQGNPDGYNWDGFGNLVSRGGTNPTGFAWGGGSGYQTDNDSGLKLLGHRYYDSRTGRFLSQDPAGDGDNWYAYAGNDPMNGADPTGLEPQIDMQPDWGNTSDPGWMNEPAGVDSGSTYDCPGMGWMSVGNDGFWHQGVSASVANYTTENVSGPADANNLGFGGFVDNNVTFGAIGRAGNTAGLYDAGKASRGAVIGTVALAGVAIVGAALSDGEDAAVVDAERGIGGWITKDVFSTLEQKVGKADLRKFVAALKKGVVGPRGESGIKRLGRPVGDFTHELKIGGSGNRILGKLGQWEGQAKYIFSELSGHLD